MAPFIALALASSPAPAAGVIMVDPGGQRAMTSAGASARVLPAARIRQGREVVADGPAMQLNRQPDGTVLVEFT